ncbi:uncharacterized protein TNCV_828471 [Trichonephila clavipes]|nr:uncharacterized protein TNCV_828471 [Trichonephila clavipes]
MDRRAPNNSKNRQWCRLGKLGDDERRLRQFVDVCCTVDCMQGYLYTGSPSRQTIDSCVGNGVMNTEPGGLIGNKLFFLTNPALICGTTMAAFVLDAMPVNAPFQNTLSNVILDKHPDIWSEVRLRIIVDLSCY